MEDEDVLKGIKRLTEEEHSLFEKESRGEITEESRQRLRQVEIGLDQCWDLLRQRRARREAGLKPDDATVRDPRTVEGYLG
jgi:uncharacterized protein DUF2630